MFKCVETHAWNSANRGQDNKVHEKNNKIPTRKRGAGTISITRFKRTAISIVSARIFTAELNWNASGVNH